MKKKKNLQKNCFYFYLCNQNMKKAYCQNSNCKHKRMTKVNRFNEGYYDFVFCSIECWAEFKKNNQEELEELKNNYEAVKQTTRRKHDKK